MCLVMSLSSLSSGYPLSEPGGLAACGRSGGDFIAGSPRGNRVELCLGERAASLEAEIDDAQKRGERVDRRCAFGAHVVAKGEQHLKCRARWAVIVADRNEVDDGDDVLAAARVGPDVLIDADHAGPVEPGRVVDQQLVTYFEDSGVDGVPGSSEVRGHPHDRHPVNDRALQRSVDRVPGQPCASGGRGVLAPHRAVVAATVAANSDLQGRWSPAERDVHDRPGHRAAGNFGLTATMAPRRPSGPGNSGLRGRVQLATRWL